MYRVKTWKLLHEIGNSQGNQMETSSLKTLAYKVLHGNPEGNNTETQSFQQGNLITKRINIRKLPASEGHILPEDIKEAYEERAIIMEYEGGLDREEAERQSWCRTACMLSFPSQWKACERFYPKFCLKLTDTRLTDAAFGLPTEAVPEKSNKPELTN